MKIHKNKIAQYCFNSKLNVILCSMSLLLLSSLNTVTAAEYVYISDKLRVGVRVEPVSGVPPIAVVFTGMRLKVHEKKDGYLKITTDKGITGWIKDIYVTQKEPAVIQLNTLRKKHEELKKQLSKANEDSAILEKANLALNNQLEALKSERRQWSTERAKLMASQYKDSSWFWVIELIVLLVASFAAGIFWYKSYVMKRLGGLRV